MSTPLSLFQERQLTARTSKVFYFLDTMEFTSPGTPSSTQPSKGRHKRGNSFFRSFSGDQKLSAVASMQSLVRRKPNHTATLTQSHIEKPAWDGDSIGQTSTSSHHSKTSSISELNPLRIVGLEKGSPLSSNWEKEITTELDHVHSRSVSCTDQEFAFPSAPARPPSPPLQKTTLDPGHVQAVTLPAISIPSSSPDLDSLVRSKHSSTVSTISTLRHFSIISIDASTSHASLGVSLPSTATDCETPSVHITSETDASFHSSPPSPQSLDAPQETQTGTSKKPKPYFSSTMESQSEEGASHTRNFTPSSIASTPSEYSVGSPVSLNSNMSFRTAPNFASESLTNPVRFKDDTHLGQADYETNPSMLSYKRDKIRYRRNVSKASISMPTGLVDTESHFTANPDAASDTSKKEYKRGHRSRNSLISGISTSSLFKSFKRDPSPAYPVLNEPRTPQASASYANLRPSTPHVATKKNSFSDMRKSFLSMSSSTGMFRSSSSSSSRKSFLSGSFNFPGTGSDSNVQIEKTIISLPTPVEASREKLRNKLRASTSLLSLTRNNTSQGSLAIAVPVEQHNLTQLETLLSMCKTPSILDFQAYIDRTKYTIDMQKTADSPSSEIFYQPPTEAMPAKIFKIIPFGSGELDQSPVEQVLKDISIARELTRLDGYADILDVSVVKGAYPPYLLSLCDQYALANLPTTTSTHPSSYKDTQLYCVIVQAYAGIDLARYPLDSWSDAESIFWQTVAALAQGESLCQFEHRDLNWSNIVIQDKPTADRMRSLSSGSSQHPSSPVLSDGVIDEARIIEEMKGMILARSTLKITVVNYTLSRATDGSGATIHTRLDHPDFYRGKGDYQFDVYRYMRSLIINRHGETDASPLPPTPTTATSAYFKDRDTAVGAGVIDWSLFCPRTNVLWLHYLADKLLNAKGLGRVYIGKGGRVISQSGAGSDDFLGGEPYSDQPTTPVLGNQGGNRKSTFEGDLLADEARACKCLETIARSLNPRRKQSNTVAVPSGGNGGGAGGGRKGYPVSSSGSSSSSFADFGSATDVLKWGIRAKVFPGYGNVRELRKNH